jgi:Serine/threonine protein kinase
MTQWIFRAELCACERTDIGWKFDFDSRGIESSPDTGDEKELQLDPSAFPVERYKPLCELGSGASGTVYGCRDKLLGKPVAVKILHRLTAEQLVAFQNEARATSKLHHPAILQLLDFGPTDSGIPYMVLEYFNSITLGDYIDSHGPLEVSQFLQYFFQ